MAPRRFAHRIPKGPEVRGVDLLGETSDWLNPIRLDRESDEVFATELSLDRGIYQYKFLVHSTERSDWVLDHENPRTRSDGGRANSIAVIDGAPEPFLFAASPPWVEELDRGGLRVLIGRRRGAGEAGVSLMWSEDDGASWSTTICDHAFDEDEHHFFTATVPISVARVVFALEAPGTRFETRWTKTPARWRAPSWWKTASLYTIFVDRFRPEHDHATWEQDPGRRVAAGGHLDGIRRSLDGLLQLGVDVLYLTPVHMGASIHRYDLVDPLRVDPILGGESAYDALVRDARARGIRIVQDVSFAHAGRGFPPYEDVRTHGPASRWAPWFLWKDGKLVHYGRRMDAPLFDLTHSEVQDLALDAVVFWAKRGASGLRLDMTAEIPLELGARMRRRFRELVPDGVVFGELVPQHAWRWRSAGVLDASTDFGFQEIVTDLLCRNGASAADAFGKLTRLDLVRGGDSALTSVRFVSTHDHVRLATRLAADGRAAPEERLALAYALLSTLPGVPMLLYGEEYGLRSRDPNRHPEDVWPDRMPMPWTAKGRDVRIWETLRRLLALRRSSEAIRQGSLELLFADVDTLVYRRMTDAETLDVALNFGEEPKTIELLDEERPRLTPMATIGEVSVDGMAVKMAPFSALVGRRERALGRSIDPMVNRRNIALRDRDLVSATVSATARPSRFFFSVTERCNLRCQHCITSAPERTKNGTARTMTSAVLDALADDFGFGEYFAFVHGGESLTARIFFEVLAAIAQARGAEPYTAHVLTNGTLLDRDMAERLVRRGVSSISVSLDGATAATNDAIRLGARFEDILDHVREVVAWRKAAQADLRIGLSYVVLAQNIGELDALVDLGAELGLDWIKLEEGVPATPFARRSLVSCAAPEARRAVDRAMARGHAAGLVMVDHTVERTVWRCRLDDDTRSFLEGDETANRCTIHPCRTPWETACIEPNGDVRVRDFYGPILGNVTQAPLVELWNAPAAQELRRQAGASRLCGLNGPVVCLQEDAGRFALPIAPG